jgi:hypothetical protein
LEGESAEGAAVVAVVEGGVDVGGEGTPGVGKGEAEAACLDAIRYHAADFVGSEAVLVDKVR